MLVGFLPRTGLSPRIEQQLQTFLFALASRLSAQVSGGALGLKLLAF